MRSLLYCVPAPLNAALCDRRFSIDIYDFSKKYNFDIQRVPNSLDDGCYIEGPFSKNGVNVDHICIFDVSVDINEHEYRWDFVIEYSVNNQRRTSQKCKDPYDCFLWLARELDGNPSKFGSYDLEHHKRVKSTQVSISSEGAELYVMSHLMLDMRLLCSQASRAMPGYDLLVSDPLNQNKIAKIQVKYRTGIKSPNEKKRRHTEQKLTPNNLDFDFLVVVSEQRYFTENCNIYTINRTSNQCMVSKNYSAERRKVKHAKPSCWVMSKSQIEFDSIVISDDCYEDWDKIYEFFANDA